MARLLPLYVLLLLAAVAGCAHGPASAALATLKPAAEAFHRSIRWRDFRGAEDLIVPERRALFEKAIRARSDEKDLSITDYQLEDIRLSADGTRGIVVSRVSWVRLPSVTESSATVTSEFVFQGGTWLLERQDAGPFAAELSEPSSEPRPSPAAP